MAFQLTLPYLGPVPTIELSEAEYARLLQSANMLRFAYDIEEKLHMVLGNYEEFEAELLRLGLRNMLYHKQDTFDFASDIFVVRRRIANLLTSCRQYLDQTEHSLMNSIAAGHKVRQQYRQWRDDKKHGSLSYRLVWALRNQIQHESAPIELSWHHHRVSVGNEQVIATHIKPTLYLSKLAVRHPLTQDDVDRLQAEGKDGSIILAPYLREYVDLLGELHIVVRTAIAQDVAQSQAVVLEARQALVDKGASSNARCLLLTREPPDGTPEKNTICLDPIEHRQLLERKPLALGNLRNQVVTNAALD